MFKQRIFGIIAIISQKSQAKSLYLCKYRDDNVIIFAHITYIYAQQFCA